jgi:Tetratricopeptide repeat/TIR domain/NB-ARC domain
VRRREVPGIDDSGPYFFLSYRHTPKFDDHDETDPDVWAAKLYKDLCAHLFQISSLPLSGRLGFMDRELRPGNEWPMKLATALATCRVLVPLYSPRYFSSEHCGREWSAFARRAADMAVRGPEHPEAIIPALWVPVRPEQLPEAARAIHYLSGDYGSAYATHGFYRLMRLSKYQDDYEEAVYELARRIRDVAENSPVTHGPVVEYDSLVNAFGADFRRTQDDGRHRVVSVPQRRDERGPKPAPIAWNVPARNAAFTGRDQVLDSLREQLTASGRSAGRPAALHGPGGVGKTQIAVEYAHRHMADYDVVWRVSAEQRDLINAALAELAGHLGLHVGDSITDNAQAVRDALRRGRPSPRWLLIFDNADDPDELAPFLPGGPGQVLVTSRNPGWSRVAEPVDIDVFTRTESLEYLQRRVPSLSSEDAGIVAEVLGDLPLAIEHASAWLAETAMPADGYVARLNDQFNAAESLSDPLGYPPSVAATLRLSFDWLRERSPAAARVLELCAYFAPDPISLSLLYSDEMTSALLAFDRRLRERDIMGKLLRDIERYSLAKVDRGSNSIQVHRLIQAGIRAQMAPQRYREDAMHEVHQVLVGARPRQGNTDDPENWGRYDLIWPHLGPSEAYRCGSPDTRQLLIDMVRYLWKRGEFKAALEVGERLEEQWTGTIGPQDRQTLYLRFHIANVLRSQGRFQAAHDLDTDVFSAQREVLGDDDPNTLQTAGSLGGDLRALGCFRDALALDERTYSQLRDMMGPDHPSALSAANNLAIDLRLVGDCFRARDIDLDTLSQRERVLGPDHPYTLHSASMLARDLREAGDYAWSIELLRETHRRYRTVLGEDYVDTLQTAKNLAVSLRKVGHYDEAYELTKDASDRFARNYGVVHPEALACRLNLACDLSARGKKAEAHELARKVLLAYQDALGARHPFTLAAQSNIATYLRGRGSVPGALALANRTLSALSAVLGDDHPFTLSCAVNKANCLHDDGQLSAAEGLLRETLEQLKKKLGDQHPDALICAGNLAVTLHTLGRADEARLLQRQVVAGMGPVLGEGHPSIGILRAWRLHNRDLEVQPT